MHIADDPIMATSSTLPVWRLSVRQYHDMIQAGILTADDPVELLNGLLIRKMTRNPLHRAVTHLIRQSLERSLPAGWYVDSQEPITLDDSEPEPDVVVVRGDTRDYLTRHPGPADLALVVEVAEASLQRDREWKKRLYAGAGIPAYWLFNLVRRQVEVFTEPDTAAASYRSGTVHGPDDMVTVVLDEHGIELRVGECFPELDVAHGTTKTR